MLGKIRVIITTPDIFLDRASQQLIENARSNPVARDNLPLLATQSNRVLLSIQHYSRADLAAVVAAAGRFHACQWAKNSTYTEIIADVLFDHAITFDALTVLCRDHKQLDDEGIIACAEAVIEASSITRDILSAETCLKHILCAALVGEALIEFSREFRFQSALTFADLCAAGGISTTDYLALERRGIPHYLIEDRVSTQNFSDFPVFAHPDIRAAAGSIAEGEGRAFMHHLVRNITGANLDYAGRGLMRWESVHLFGRMAPFLQQEDVEFVRSNLFFLRLSSGGDSRNVLWAIVNNWATIQGSPLQNEAMGFLKHVATVLTPLVRPLIWEVMDNWAVVNDDVRRLAMSTTGKSTGDDKLQLQFNQYHSISFMAACIANYGVIQSQVAMGSPVAEQCLELLNTLISYLAKNSGNPSFTSRKDDGLFPAPSNTFTGADVLRKLLEFGNKRGSFTNSHPLANHLRLQLEKAS